MMTRPSKKERRAADPFAGGGKAFLLVILMSCLAAFSVLSIKISRAAETKLAKQAQQQEANMMAGFKVARSGGKESLRPDEMILPREEGDKERSQPDEMISPEEGSKERPQPNEPLSPEEEAKFMAEFQKRMRDHLKKGTSEVRPLAPKAMMYPKWRHGSAGSAPTPLGAQAPQILPTFQRPDGGAFVHMGKTGGSALSVLLRNGCHSWMAHPCRNVTNETIASELIESYYHVPDFAFLRQSQHDFYVITLRDPFDRAVSAFVFEHILNRIVRNDLTTLTPSKQKVLENAYACFPTLEKFVSHLKGNSSSYYYPYKKNAVMPTPCRDFARAAFHGQVRPFNHMYFSFQRIKTFLPAPDSQTILVTRQERLWDDWKSINKWLGHDREVVIPEKVDHAEIRNTTHLQLPVTRRLSPEGTQTLCAALQGEYDTYVWFLKRAKNLNANDVLKSVGQARRRCPKLKVNLNL
jgi:hypothetical protein